MGDPEHPVSRGSLCRKCSSGYNGVWQDESSRLLYPLRRVGRKGEGRFERISWEEAIDAVAGRLLALCESPGPESIVYSHYSGTLSLLASTHPERFYNRLGATEVAGGTICNDSGHAAWKLLFGESYVGFDPRTARDSRCILVWGANPSHSAPHVDEHWLADSPARVVVVDPLRTRTAARADLHLQPRPGSDAALAFGLLHVLHRSGRFDDGFIDAHTLGADELIPRLAGCTPEWCEGRTGVPAESVVRAAEMYGAGPSLLWAGQALCRQRQGGNIMRAVGLLPALTGQIGRPGTGFYFLNHTAGIAGLDFDAYAGTALRRGPASPISFLDLADRLADPTACRAFLCSSSNPAASAPRQGPLREALSREDLFTVAVDCFPTDTTDFADVILPAASFLEFDDLTFGYFHLIVGVQSRVRAPMGESLPNQEIFRRLGRAMHFEEEDFRSADEDLLEDALRRIGTGFGFEELRRRGFWAVGDEPIQFWADGRFPTPSGRIEIASSTAEEQGLPRLPQPTVDALPRGSRLRLLTPASDHRLNTSFGNDAKSRKRAGEARVILHPEDASRLGLAAGDRARLTNEAGAIDLAVRVEPLAPPGVAVCYKGRWPKTESDRCNVNVVNPGERADMAESSAVHSVEVEIRRA
jgi:anaerobic selenocysteine-containing dehydrogenase